MTKSCQTGAWKKKQRNERNEMEKKESINKIARIIEDEDGKNIRLITIFSGWRGELVGKKILDEFEILDN